MTMMRVVFDALRDSQLARAELGEMMKNADERTLRFGKFVLEAKPLRLLNGDVEVKLRRQALTLLRSLAIRSGQFVSHEEIRIAVWGERCVDNMGGTHLLIREIRQALGDEATNPKYIETLPRQGYRFIEPVSKGAPPKKQSSQAKLKRQFFFAGIGSAAIIMMVFFSISNGWFSSDVGTFSEHSTAHKAYLKGDYLLDLGGSENLLKAEQFFIEALEIDKSFALAQVGLAVTSARQGDFDKAEMLANRALELDENSAEAHNALAWVAINRDWNWTEAESNINRSLSLDPDNPTTHSINAWLMIVVGRRDDAKRAAQRAFELDPVSAMVRTDNGWYHYFVGDFATGLQICTEARHLDPSNTFAIRCQYKSALSVGDYAIASNAAARILEDWESAPDLVNKLRREPGLDNLRLFFDIQRNRLKSKEKNSEGNAVQLALGYAEIGDLEHAAELLPLALETPDPQLPYLLRDPALVPIHEDPRYLEAVKFTGIPN